MVAFISVYGVYGYKNNVNAARAEIQNSQEQVTTIETKESEQQNTEVIFISCNGFF